MPSLPIKNTPRTLMPPLNRPTNPLLIGLVILAGCVTSLTAQDAEDPLSWDRKISRHFQKYCYKCHRDDKTNGDINLAQDVDLRMILDHRETWEKVLFTIEGKEMPPEDEKNQPSDEERELLIKFLQKTLVNIDCEKARDPGKPPLRRLNRTEYDNSIKHLIGLDLKLAEDFPPDPTSYGFDHIGESLNFAPVQIEQYHSAAKKAVDAVIAVKMTNKEVYQKLFGSRAEKNPDEVADQKEVRQLVQHFSSRAYRRPVDAAHLDKLMAIYGKAIQKEDRESSLKHVYTAVLMSPRFLVRIEANRTDSDEPYLVDDFELATRLSYFLWSAPPDSELLKIALKGELNQQENLINQTRRMIADPRSEALADNFFGQWLSLRDLKSHQPDSKAFPDFNEDLRSAMIAEIRGLLSEVVQKNKPISELIDADYTYLNERLAKHYDLNNIQGNEVRRVSLTDRRRGGILTSAGWIMLLADPARNNVPRKGNFLASHILGTPPPPPPPNVPSLETSAKDGKVLSLRQLLEQHRSQPSCANCHAKIDSLGFALENYDAIGRWRTHEGDYPIDASGELLTGQKFNGPVELKDVLIAQKEAFAKVLIKNLMIYAYGRGLQGPDECTTREILQAAVSNEFRFGAIVEAVVNSYPFRYRKNPID